MRSFVRKLNNGYIQGSIFLINLIFRPLFHQVIRRKLSVSKSISKEIRKRRKSDTLFILGSGLSILELNEEKLLEIRSNDSVGFNFWLLHELVPTFYTAEFIADNERSDILWKNLSLRANDYQNTPVILKYSRELLSKWQDVPKLLNEKYISNSLAIPGVSEKPFCNWLKVLDNLGLLTGDKLGDVMLYKQASLTWLLVFALRMHYKKVILCGIDLDSPEYFFEKDSSYCDSKGLIIPPSGFSSSIHPTNDPDHFKYGMPITKIIEIFNREVLSRHQLELYTGSNVSALFPLLPLYEWDENRLQNDD